MKESLNSAQFQNQYISADHQESSPGHDDSEIDHEHGMPATAITLVSNHSENLTNFKQAEDEMTAEKNQIEQEGYDEDDGRENAAHEADQVVNDNDEEEGASENDDDYDDSNPPLLFVDVNLGANEQQRIVVYEGDTA